MNEPQWKIFCNFKDDFFAYIESIKNSVPELKEIQKAAAEKSRTPSYSFENPVVYNTALGDVKKEDDIRLIVIGDNPGKNEQLNQNRRYLVGQAGKIADGWFKKNPELKIDFRKNVIILNKTPVHSAKTSQLKIMEQLGGKKIARLIEESQIWMAEHTASLHHGLFENADDEENFPELWLVGYAELKNNGIFQKYKNTLIDSYKNFNDAELWNSVLVFQHFSMNRFSIDLKDFQTENAKKTSAQPLFNTLHELGTLHRKEIFLK